jgi:hypothetical protein
MEPNEIINSLRGSVEVLGIAPGWAKMATDAADAIESLQSELERVKAARDKAVECIKDVNRLARMRRETKLCRDGTALLVESKTDEWRGMEGPTQTDTQEPWKQKIMNDFMKVE